MVTATLEFEGIVDMSPTRFLRVLANWLVVVTGHVSVLPVILVFAMRDGEVLIVLKVSHIFFLNFQK